MTKSQELNTLDSNKKYTFNKTNKKYIFHSEAKFGTNLVFPEQKINNILKLYSNFDQQPHTATAISIKMGIPKDVIMYILKTLNKTHDSAPFSNETVENVDVDTLVEDMVYSKEFSITQKFQKEDWKKTQEFAEKWRKLQNGTFDPISQFLDNWTPPKYIPTKSASFNPKGDKVLLVGCSDWHYGIFAEERYLYNQQEWNIDLTKKSVALYATKLKQKIIEKNEYKKINLCFLGDISHTLDGFTDKGTKIEAHPIGEEQLEQAFNSMVLFVQEILSVHSNIEVFSCSGNHSALGDYVLVKMLSIFFRGDKRIKFNITNKRNLTFRIYDNLFLMEHGYSSVAKSRLPAPGKGRETYINNLFMCKPELMTGAKHLIYLSADVHHSESYELTNVEGYMFSTLVAGCRYSDNSGYKSRPRQSCLVVDQSGVIEHQHYYFD